MKYGREWVQKLAQCPDGAAWGLEYVKDGPRAFGEAVAGFQRADWLLWFLVKTKAVSLEYAFNRIWEKMPEWIETEEARGFLDRVQNEPTPATPEGRWSRIVALRSLTARTAEAYMTVQDFPAGHELSAVTFLLRFQAHLIEGEHDEALKDGQCLLNNVVAARIKSLNFTKPEALNRHRALCRWLRDALVPVGESA